MFDVTAGNVRGEKVSGTKRSVNVSQSMPSSDSTFWLVFRCSPFQSQHWKLFTRRMEKNIFLFFSHLQSIFTRNKSFFAFNAFANFAPKRAHSFYVNIFMRICLQPSCIISYINWITFEQRMNYSRNKLYRKSCACEELISIECLFRQ